MKCCVNSSIPSIQTENMCGVKNLCLLLHCFQGPCDPNSTRGYIKVGLVFPGFSYLLCPCAQDWNDKQQFHLLIATLHVGGRHFIVGFSEWHIGVC